MAIKHATTFTNGTTVLTKTILEEAHAIEDDSVGEGKLIIVASPTDGYILAWSDADGKLKWIANTHAQLHDRSHDVESSSDHAASTKKGLFLKTNSSTGAIEIVAHGLGYGDVGAEVSGAAATHAALTTGVHGVAGGIVAKVADVATDGNLSVAAQAAITASHAAVTLSTELDAILALSTQALDLDTQAANVVIAGPATGAAAKPTARALVAADIPSTFSQSKKRCVIITLGAAESGQTNTSYATFWPRVTVDFSMFDKIASIKFGVMMAQTAAGTFTCYAQLYDVTGDAAISASELSAALAQWGTSCQLSGDVKANMTLTSARTYALQGKVQSGGTMVPVHSWLEVYQTE